MLREISRDFFQFDKDRSGMIDVQEFNRFYDLLLERGTATKPKYETLRELDTDRSGKITYNEYVLWHFRKHGDTL